MNYRLDCDYGTAVITSWEDGGSEPIYVCESHAKQLGRSREHCSDVRIITDQLDRSDNSIISEDRTQIREVACAEPKDYASSEAACGVADAYVALAVKETPASLPVRELTYGNSAKAIVDEAIWNLAAGGQLAVVRRKISDYTLKLEAVLSESEAIISAREAIDKPLEEAMLEVISNGAMSDLEKDAAIQQLGALQEWIKHGLQGDITPLQANRIILAIGDRLDWGRTAEVSEEFKPVYRALFGSLKTAICTAVPGALNLHDRITNLYAAKSDLETN